METAFKKCTICAHQWHEVLDLIRDKDVYINGYQASFSNAYEGLFIFTHNVEGCGTTLAIPAGSLEELYNGPRHTIQKVYTDECDGHCLDPHDLAPCPNACAMQWVRDILQILVNHGPEEIIEKLEQLKTSAAA